MPEDMSADIKQESLKLHYHIDISDKELTNAQYFLLEQCPYQHYLKLLELLKCYDLLTYHHCIAVAILTILLCNRLNIEGSFKEKTVLGALLHDIGKVHISKAILSKPSALTKREYEIMRQHTWRGYQLLNEDITVDKVTKEIVLCHHEREDGTGYPFGYKSEDLEKPVKIVAVCDFYHALMADRCYRKGLPIQIVESMAQREALDEESRLYFKSLLLF